MLGHTLYNLRQILRHFIYGKKNKKPSRSMSFGSLTNGSESYKSLSFQNFEMEEDHEQRPLSTLNYWMLVNSSIR